MELTLVESETFYPLMKELSLINRSTKRAQSLANQHFFHSKPMEESVILNIQYAGLSTFVKLKAHILVGYFPFFDQKSYIMTFF